MENIKVLTMNPELHNKNIGVLWKRKSKWCVGLGKNITFQDLKDKAIANKDYYLCDTLSDVATLKKVCEDFAYIK